MPKFDKFLDECARDDVHKILQGIARELFELIDSEVGPPGRNGRWTDMLKLIGDISGVLTKVRNRRIFDKAIKLEKGNAAKTRRLHDQNIEAG